MEFQRTSRRKIRALNLTPLIDVLFILIIFFMLTTSFMRIESMELILPGAAGAKTAAAKQEVVRLFVSANGDITLGSRKLKPDELSDSLSRILENDPDTRIMLLTADGVTMQEMVDVMDRVSMIGGKSLLVRKWVNAKKAS